MNDEAYHRAVFVRTILQNPFIPIIKPEKNEDGSFKLSAKGRPLMGRPSPKQIEFLAYMGLEALYGGSAGGGKTDCLLMCALQYVEIPGYSAIIFRRTLKMLEKADGLIPRSLEWGLKQKGAIYNYSNRIWTFPSGATIEFGYIDHRKDLENYQGGAWHLVCIDEAGQMEPDYIRYMFSRLRKAEGSRIPIRMRLASNPGGVGHEYLKRRFVVPGAPKFFVPSRVDDNPGLDVGEYVRSLQELDPILKAQLLAGDWSAYEGGRFKRAWFKEFVVRTDLNGLPRYHLQIGKDKFTQSPKFDEVGVLVRDCWNAITVDPACTEDDSNCPTAIGVYSITPNRDVIVLEVVRKFLDIDAIVPEIVRLSEGYAPIWVGIEDAGAFASISNAARRHPSIPAVKSISHESKSKLVRATPAIIRTEAGQVFTPQADRFPWVEDFIAECVQFTGDEEQDAYTDQVDQFGHLVRTVDRMGLGGAAVVYREWDTRELEDKERDLNFVDMNRNLLEFDEWEASIEESQNYGGLTGWKP